MPKKRSICLSCKKHPTTGKWCKYCAPRMRVISLKEKYANGYISPWEYPDSPTTTQKRRAALAARMDGVRYEDI